MARKTESRESFLSSLEREHLPCLLFLSLAHLVYSLFVVEIQEMFNSLKFDVWNTKTIEER